MTRISRSDALHTLRRRLKYLETRVAAMGNPPSNGDRMMLLEMLAMRLVLGELGALPEQRKERRV